MPEESEPNLEALKQNQEGFSKMDHVGCRAGKRF